MKGGDILDFWKGRNLREGGVDLEKGGGGGGMTPLTNYGSYFACSCSGRVQFSHHCIMGGA